MRELRLTVSYASAAALGDVRRAETGDTIVLHSDATRRKDWARYAEAITVALGRGADIRKVAK